MKQIVVLFGFLFVASAYSQMINLSDVTECRIKEKGVDPKDQRTIIFKQVDAMFFGEDDNRGLDPHREIFVEENSNSGFLATEDTGLVSFNRALKKNILPKKRRKVEVLFVARNKDKVTRTAILNLKNNSVKKKKFKANIKLINFEFEGTDALSTVDYNLNCTNLLNN